MKIVREKEKNQVIESENKTVVDYDNLENKKSKTIKFDYKSNWSLYITILGSLIAIIFITVLGFRLDQKVILSESVINTNSTIPPITRDDFKYMIDNSSENIVVKYSFKMNDTVFYICCGIKDNDGIKEKVYFYKVVPKCEKYVTVKILDKTIEINEDNLLGILYVTEEKLAISISIDVGKQNKTYEIKL